MKKNNEIRFSEIHFPIFTGFISKFPRNREKSLFLHQEIQIFKAKLIFSWPTRNSLQNEYYELKNIPKYRSQRVLSEKLQFLPEKSGFSFKKKYFQNFTTKLSRNREKSQFLHQEMRIFKAKLIFS